MNAQLEMRLIAQRPRPAKARAYFDTTMLPVAELGTAITRAELQDEKVLAVYRAQQSMTPSECLRRLEAVGVRILITSVRRSISTLTDAGALQRTNVKTRGPWGAMEGIWAINVTTGRACAPGQTI